ncbi:hypothetical protein ENBRE01_0329 [Enteropsectra breve]|nr:hypothetical protein ENBRE01_0329 [Enteropsectra breve]
MLLYNRHILYYILLASGVFGNKKSEENESALGKAPKKTKLSWRSLICTVKKSSTGGKKKQLQAVDKKAQVNVNSDKTYDSTEVKPATQSGYLTDNLGSVFGQKSDIQSASHIITEEIAANTNEIEEISGQTKSTAAPSETAEDNAANTNEIEEKNKSITDSKDVDSNEIEVIADQEIKSNAAPSETTKDNAVNTNEIREMDDQESKSTAAPSDATEEIFIEYENMNDDYKTGKEAFSSMEAKVVAAKILSLKKIFGVKGKEEILAILQDLIEICEIKEKDTKNIPDSKENDTINIPDSKENDTINIPDSKEKDILKFSDLFERLKPMFNTKNRIEINETLKILKTIFRGENFDAIEEDLRRLNIRTLKMIVKRKTEMDLLMERLGESIDEHSEDQDNNQNSSNENPNINSSEKKVSLYAHKPWRKVEKNLKMRVRDCQVTTLKNGTYACFINAPLLGLLFLPKFRNYILENGKSPTAKPVTAALHHLMSIMETASESKQIKMVNDLLKALNSEAGSNFSRDDANDTDVFIGTLLDMLSKEISTETNNSLLKAYEGLIEPEIVEKFRCADGTEKLRNSCGRYVYLQNNFDNTMEAVEADFAEIALDKSYGPSCAVCGKRSAECKIYKAVERPSEYLFVKINRRNHDASYSKSKYEISEYIRVGEFTYKRVAAILFSPPGLGGRIGHYTLQLWKENQGFYLLDDSIIYDFDNPGEINDNLFMSQTSTGIYELHESDLQ